MYEPGDNCHLHTMTRGNIARVHHTTLPAHVVHQYTQQLPQSATLQAGHQTHQRYRLVRQQSNDCLRPGHLPRDHGHVTGSTQSSPTHSVLQPAYSSPHMYNSQHNIYAEVETDYELDSGFTEESVSDGTGDTKRDDSSVYTNYTNNVWPGHHQTQVTKLLQFTMKKLFVSSSNSPVQSWY